MNVLGFSGIQAGHFYERAYKIRFVGHDSSAALIQDGKIIFAVEKSVSLAPSTPAASR